MSANPDKISTRALDDAAIERLLQQHELLDATELIANMGHCHWDYNDNHLISCSEGYARIFNMSIEEVIEFQSDWDRNLAHIHPDDVGPYLAAYESQQESGHYTVKYRILRNDGELRWLREVGLLQFDENHQVVEAFGILQDITEQEMYKTDLEYQHEVTRQVEAITDIGYFINDEENDKFLYISPGYARIHGLTVDAFLRHAESVGDNLFPVHADDRERLLAEIASYIENGDDNFKSEYRVVRPDGEVVWVRERSNSRLKKNGRVTLTLGVVQDITEKRNYEQNLQNAKDSLEETVAERTQQLADTVSQLQQEISEREVVSTELEIKNAELERFAYTVSHDLKSPLVTIKGFLGLLNQDMEARDLDRARDDIAKLNQAADTMGRLLEELLELSRIGRVIGEPVTCSMTEIAQQALQLVETTTAGKTVDIEVAAMPESRGDKTRLIEVYQNLIENAIKFMGDQPAPRIEIGSINREGCTCFFVRDNGIGIAAEYHDLIFGLFERLSPNIEGTGVGLALVKRILEVHKGKIWIESEGPGQGTSVVFTLQNS